MRTTLSCLLPALVIAFAITPASAQDQDDAIAMQDALVIERVGQSARYAIRTDAVEHRVVHDRWTPPNDGDEIELPDGSIRTWETRSANDDGWIRARGWVSWQITVPTARVVMLEAAGHSHVNVNGTPRTGDPYNYGFLSLPVELRAGENELLFRASRGRVRASLRPIASRLALRDTDRTLPDLIDGATEPTHAAVVAINAYPTPISNAAIEVTHGGVTERSPTQSIPAMSLRKLAFRLPPPTSIVDGTATYTVTLDTQFGSASTTIERTIRAADQLHAVTFVSDIDRSVQHYVVQPRSQDWANDSADAALILSMHGASVKARRQARGYSQKDWCTTVAPTNRRPFGFDWEDWGRLDALEVLGHAAARIEHDPARVYATGHSMGGHGTWHMGATFPDRFAAIGPSAGWVSFWSYGGAPTLDTPTGIDSILRRAANASDTIALERNLDHLGVYILHGDADDNVPVDQARTMRSRLADFHTDFAYYERPGAGHWWGDRCMDWPPMMEFLRAHRNPPTDRTTAVRFTTMSPAVNDRCNWARVHQQHRSMEPSSIDLQLTDVAISGTTQNVRILVLDLGAAGLTEGTIPISIDGTDLEAPAGAEAWLLRDADTWTTTQPPAPHFKGPHRAGPFKEAFRNGMVFVHGTAGDDLETRLNLEKARFDAEHWYYRANGAVDIIDDKTFKRRATGEYRDRNIILYGNASTNSAWGTVLGDAPVYITRDYVQIDANRLDGDDLACVFCFPRAGSDTATVGVVAGTGTTGTRLAMRMPYFVSGVGYPDVTVLTPRMLTDGVDGVAAAGFLGFNWAARDGEFVINGR